MGTSFKAVGTGAGIVKAVFTELSEQPNGNYYFMLDGVGVVMVRKTSATSWKIFNASVKRAELEALITELVGDVEFEIEAHLSLNWNVEILKQLFWNQAPAVEEKPKKKKGKKEEVESPNPFKVAKKMLDATYPLKAVKKAFKSADFEKKEIKKFTKALAQYEKDGDVRGYDILDAVDEVNGKAPEPSVAKTIFNALM